MSETESDLESIEESIELPTRKDTDSSNKGITVTPTPERSLEVLPESLERASLTVSQQLHKSGNLLTDSMETIVKSPDFVAKERTNELVNLANALATTATTQAELLKVMKGFRE